VNAAVTYLDMAAWNALVLGSLGVAMVIYLHIEQRLDTVAVMKVLGADGARSWSSICWRSGVCRWQAVHWCGSGDSLERIFLLLSRGHVALSVCAIRVPWSQAGVARGLGMLASLMAAAMPLAARARRAPAVISAARSAAGGTLAMGCCHC